MKSMRKVKIDNNAFVYPMPMVLVGAMVEGRPNVMPVAWVSRVNYQPPLLAVAIGNSHHTIKGIREGGFFSVNVPGVGSVQKTDYCGLVSGAKADKSKVFDFFYGDHKVPLIEECPVALECRVVNSVKMEADTLFIGEIVGAWSEEQYLKEGKPAVEKIKPFCLTMPDNHYWSVGKKVGQAWGIGKELIRK